MILIRMSILCDLRVRVLSSGPRYRVVMYVGLLLYILTWGAVSRNGVLVLRPLRDVYRPLINAVSVLCGNWHGKLLK